jgi:hypothetical protein
MDAGGHAHYHSTCQILLIYFLFWRITSSSKFKFHHIYLSIGNHKNIFNDARVPWSEYRYYDPKTVGLDFEGMIADIEVPSISCI